ncbi:NUMOD4 motif-containing HNH endonuclease [Lactobacillus kefiranofaciens]|uniref:NUMOD4 domain-containing protein n=1 Tax=Lactobacillus kefiranofaciens TaxID=267818 RepID=UPI0024686AAA|nr:NUMOD4 domain-containing protein [Lactobacillus kefiranofaciens]MDH5099776.1 NUMOD4 motif-containing HNH endonuclease [Lactobacillus kefiranofaciens]
MVEKWKPVPIKEFANSYMVSNLGRVKSIPHYVKGRWGQPVLYRGKILKAEMRKYYLSVQLYSKNIKKKHFNIHRLVALAFVPGHFDGAVVNHKNENKLDNRAQNLEWVTVRSNILYGFGKRHSALKISKRVMQLDDTGKIIHTYPSLHDAGKELKIEYQAIYHSVHYGYKAGGYKWKYAEAQS